MQCTECGHEIDEMNDAYLQIGTKIYCDDCFYYAITSEREVQR